MSELRNYGMAWVVGSGRNDQGKYCVVGLKSGLIKRRRKKNPDLMYGYKIRKADGAMRFRLRDYCGITRAVK